MVSPQLQFLMHALAASDVVEHIESERNFAGTSSSMAALWPSPVTPRSQNATDEAFRHGGNDTISLNSLMARPGATCPRAGNDSSPAGGGDNCSRVTTTTSALAVRHRPL